VQPMAVVCTRRGKQGKVYLAADDPSLATARTTARTSSGLQHSNELSHSNNRSPQQVEDVTGGFWPDDAAIWQRIRKLEAESANDPLGLLTVPDEPIITDAKGSAWVTQYGITHFGDLFIPRQLLALFTFVRSVRAAKMEMQNQLYDDLRGTAVVTCLAFVLDRLADWNSTLCTWAPEKTGGAKIRNTFARQALPMVWDFTESGIFGDATGSASLCLDWVVKGIQEAQADGLSAVVNRGSATKLDWPVAFFDAIITDPPYYDNIAYADLSDFFYVWLKRSIGLLYSEHFSSQLTPKKGEAVADATRHQGDRERAAAVYEEMMVRAFAEAGRVLKPNAPLVVVYAHKTTLGWATLVDALRVAGFTVTEAWPLDTEMAVRIRAVDTASLASSIFIVARRREGDETGSYERRVRPELQTIVRSRLDRLWAQGVTGADLVIACVGAGLSAFTRYARVEYANGAAVPADSFLAEVEGEVLEALLEKLFGVSQAGMGSVDAITRFYVLWRYAYRSAAVGAGEAIVFTYPQHVELDGSTGLTAGRNPLVEKQKSAYRLRDFTERGEDETLGVPKAAEHPPLVDVLHRLLWLVENRPGLIPAYLDEARPDVERLRVVAQTLAGQALAGNGSGGGKSLIAARGAEASALRKLTTNWRTLVEAHRGPLA
jgi:putative DNA methylase